MYSIRTSEYELPPPPLEHDFTTFNPTPTVSPQIPTSWTIGVGAIWRIH